MASIPSGRIMNIITHQIALYGYRYSIALHDRRILGNKRDILLQENGCIGMGREGVTSINLGDDMLSSLLDDDL